MVHKALRAIRRFAVERGALVTIQVVLFSVMLFGAIGFVIDFGRAYSAHSQMQSFIDQVALAAAAELDQEAGSDAIARATAAAYAISKPSLFTEGTGSFQIAQLIFLTAAPTDADGNFDYSLVTGGTLTTQNPALATHVLAIAQQASVRASLLDINISGLATTVSEIPIGTFAVATRRQVTCEGLSTLVMCNPFEGDATRSLQSVFEQGEGYRLRLTASTALGLAATPAEIGLGLLKDPVATMGARSGACEDPATIPGYAGQTGAELERLRDACLLAVVEPGLACVNDAVLVKPAPPGTVVTGLDVIFDMYDDGMAEILAADLPLADGRMRSEAFAPDLAAVHGRIRRADIPDYFAALNAAIDASTTMTPMQKLIARNQNDAIRDNLLLRYPGDGNPASRLSHIPVAVPESPAGGGPHGPMPSPACFGTGCTAEGIHGAIAPVGPAPADYAAAFYTPRVRALTAQALGLPESAVTAPDGGLLAGEAVTLRDFHAGVESADASLRDYPASNGADWAGIAGNFVRAAPRNFTAVYPGVDLAATERRRLRVTVVNCGAAVEAGTGAGETALRAPVVDVVDLFLTRPPLVTACSTAFTSVTDPQNMKPCPNDAVTAAELHVEYIGSVRDNLAGSRSRTYAVLVH